MTRLSHRVYQLNVHMLGLLEADRIGRLAPRGAPAEPAPPALEPTLQIGDQGRAVRRLQRALHRSGERVAVDGRFGHETWTAVRSVQRAHRLDVDGIAGPGIWAALPQGGPMPLLRSGSSGDAVAALQRVLAEGAPTRWKVAPEAVTGTFDATTSAAVQAFQRWHALEADGLVGDHTWAAPVDDTGTSLEAAVGLEVLVARFLMADLPIRHQLQHVRGRRVPRPGVRPGPARVLQRTARHRGPEPLGHREVVDVHHEGVQRPMAIGAFPSAGFGPPAMPRSLPRLPTAAERPPQAPSATSKRISGEQVRLGNESGFRVSPIGLAGAPCGDGDGASRPVRTTPTPRAAPRPS